MPAFYVLISKEHVSRESSAFSSWGGEVGAEGTGNVQEKGVFRWKIPVGVGRGCPQPF